MASKLSQMQARFQKKQMQEKEEKLLRLYENQQQRAFERVGRGSAGSNASTGSLGSTGGGGGKVRQMFDERRQKAGVDRSYPLEPLRGKNGTRSISTDREPNAKTVVRSTVQKSVSHIQNGRPLVSKREVVHSLYNNNNGNESYEEHRIGDDNSDYLFGDDTHKNLVDMMNNHNLHDGLDSEDMPRIGFDEVDEPYFTGKLRNLGGKLPSEKASLKSLQASPVVSRGVKNGVVRKEPTISTTRKEPTKTTAKKTATPTPKPAITAKSTSPRNSASPANSGTFTKSPMSAKPKAAPPAPASAKAPQNSRPSARQSPRSAVARDDLAECRMCGRRFAADRIAVHQDICSKTGRKKRKTYDATKHRVAGTELESYVMRGGKPTRSGAQAAGRTTSRKPASRESTILKASSKSGSTAGKKDWRRTHEEFIAAIRAAKQAQAHVARGGRLADLPPPPPSSNPDYVQCPHCGRRFNEAAAERHIPKCASFQFNKPKAGPAPARNTGKR